MALADVFSSKEMRGYTCNHKKRNLFCSSISSMGILSSVPQIKYLREHISHYLKLNSHINSISSKANQTLGFLKQNFRINASSIKEKANKLFVRPKLEYCSTVWDQKTIINPKEGDKTHHRLAHQLEIVQWRAARWVTGRYHRTSSVSDILQSVDWRSLEQ